MKAIDAVIAISKALDGWDGTPEQAAEKLGAAVAIVKAYFPTPAPELTPTDKDREEAINLIDPHFAESTKDWEKLGGEFALGKAMRLRKIDQAAAEIARIRAEARAEALREAAERVNSKRVDLHDSQRGTRTEVYADGYNTGLVDAIAAILADEPQKEE